MKKAIVQKKEKYVTISIFEKAMGSVARSFNRIEEKLTNHDKAFETMFKMLRTHEEEAREHRLIMESLRVSDIKQERDIDVLNAHAGIIKLK